MTNGIAQFLERVDKTSSPEGCWVWLGSITKTGYPRFHADGHRFAHRYSYAAHNGPIPDGMHVDHTCHTHDGDCIGGFGCHHRACVNPAHLEAVTPKENSYRSKNFSAYHVRKTHCVNGHEFTAENTYIKPNGCRNCATCRADSDKRRDRRKTAA